MENRKQHIIQHVGEMFLKAGIRTITMDDIATEFGISKKTLYQYFSDKETLVSQVIEHFLQNKEMMFKASDEGNAIDYVLEIREKVAFILRVYNNNIELELKKLYPKLYKKVHQEKRNRIYTNTVENMQRGIKEGLYRDDVQIEFVAKLQVGRMLYTLNPEYNIFMEQEVNSLSFFDSMLNYHMHAICTPKGLSYFKKRLNYNI